MIVPAGTLNTAALVVPDLYVQIVPPQNLIVTGQPTNMIGFVGTAPWGPVNQPVIVYDMPSQVQSFGAPVARKYDVGTQVATAVQQGANSFKCVRVTDGTDTAATSAGVATCISFTARYTGSLGNNLTIAISAGSKANTFRAVIGVPGGQPELFDNIAGSGNAFWVNLANAINTGSGTLRPRSSLVIATAGFGTTSPVAGTYTFSGGTDGAGVNSAAVVGVDSTPRTGIYALRTSGASILVVADLDDSTQWTTIDGMAQGEGMYAVLCGPSGDTIANATTVKRGAGLDSYSTKMMFGDWITWNDPFLGQARVVSPQGFVAGRLANLSPEQSSLNKTLYSVVGSQRSASGVGSYSQAELTQLIQAGIDVIANPGAGGLSMWTVRVGHNASSNAAVQGDNYTRMTNFIAASLNAAMGLAIGKTITPALCQTVVSAQLDFFQGMLGQGILGVDVDDGGLPFGVICKMGPGTNNPPNRTKLNFLQSDAQVQYLAIAEKFIVNLQGGQTVTVTRQTTSAGQITA